MKGRKEKFIRAKGAVLYEMEAVREKKKKIKV